MVVMVFGTFDILHPGHLNFFKQARQKARSIAVGFSLYPKLIVVVARDINVKKAKKHLPKFNERTRLQNVKKLKIVDQAVLGDRKDFFKIIKKEKPEVICLGYDQKMPVAILRKELRKRGLKTKVYRLRAYKPEIYKSSRLKKESRIKNLSPGSRDYNS